MHVVEDGMLGEIEENDRVMLRTPDAKRSHTAAIFGLLLRSERKTCLKTCLSFSFPNVLCVTQSTLKHFHVFKNRGPEFPFVVIQARALYFFFKSNVSRALQKPQRIAA